MERAFKVGCRVVYFDSLRQAHEAIVTNWFNGGPEGETLEQFAVRHKSEGITSKPYIPCCNLVYVANDTNKTDPYGRQLERATSCSNGHNQSTPFLGACWAWPDEAEEAVKLAAEAYANAVVR